jgi:amidase
MSISEAYESNDATGLAELVAEGEVTAGELLDEAIARVERVNPSINAVVHDAHELARASIEAGLPEGPFRGVPFLLKDLYAEMAGTELCNGSSGWVGYESDHDTELVTRQKGAGLVIFGRTTSPEFGLTTTTESRVHGETRNPWNLGHTSGGSSGGASAAVAAGIVPMAHATDGGGSIRVPASCCGLFGLKPTRGRTPAGPDAGEGWGGMSAGHAVSWSVRDSAALLDATAGPDVGAPYWAEPPARPYLEEVGRNPGKLRIAVQRESFNGVEVHADCLAALDDAVALCVSLGHEVVEESLPSVLTPAEGKLAPSLVVIAANIRASVRARAAALGREALPEDVEPGSWQMVELSEAIDAADYADATRGVHAIGREVARFMEGYDVILSPTMATPPLEIGKLSLSRDDLAAYGTDIAKTIAFTSLFNIAGNPAMSVPLGMSKDGLPIGIQFAGRYADESTLFRLAGQLEQAAPWPPSGVRRPFGSV